MLPRQPPLPRNSSSSVGRNCTQLLSVSLSHSLEIEPREGKEKQTHHSLLHKLLLYLLNEYPINSYEMAAEPKFSYYRLKNEGWFDEGEEGKAISFKKRRKWSRGVRRFGIRNRPKLQIPGLRRFLRKRSRFFSRVKLSWGKAFKRPKNGQSQMNDLNGGNFLVLQVNHTAFKSGKKPRGDRVHGPHGCR